MPAGATASGPRVQPALDVKDEVVTTSGIYGTIRHLDDVNAHIEVAEGMIPRFDWAPWP